MRPRKRYRREMTMLKRAKCGQGPTSRGTTLTSTVRKGPRLPTNVEGQDEGDGWIGRVGEDPDRGAAFAGLAVERKQAGMKTERSLRRHEDAGVEASLADEGRSTGREGVAGVECAQTSLSTEGQPIGVKGAPVGEFKADLPDAGQRNGIDRPDPGLETHGDGARVVAGKRPGGNAAPQVDYQVLGP